MSDPRRPNIVSASDFFNQPPPDENQTASTSMGHASGTQQLYPPGSRPASRAPQRTVAQRGQHIAGNFGDNFNMGALQQPVNVFGTEVKLYILLIIAGIAFYVWGLPGVIAIGVAYWISKSFQEQAPAAPAESNRGEGAPFQPVNRNIVAPSAPLRSSTSEPSRFPGKANTLN